MKKAIPNAQIIAGAPQKREEGGGVWERNGLGGEKTLRTRAREKRQTMCQMKVRPREGQHAWMFLNTQRE